MKNPVIDGVIDGDVYVEDFPDIKNASSVGNSQKI
jgi:hypothetical protein